MYDNLDLYSFDVSMCTWSGGGFEVVRSGNARGILAESEGRDESLRGGGGSGRGRAVGRPARVIVNLGDLSALLVSKPKTNEHRDGVLKRRGRGVASQVESSDNVTLKCMHLFSCM